MTNTATMMKRYVNTCDPVPYDPLSTTVAISTVTPSKGNCQISNSNIQKEAGFSINLERLTERILVVDRSLGKFAIMKVHASNKRRP